MPGDKRTFLEWIRGKQFNDIELPNESGQVDPRLKGTSVREALAEAGVNFKKLQRDEILGGLRDAAGMKKK